MGLKSGEAEGNARGRKITLEIGRYEKKAKDAENSEAEKSSRECS